MDKPFLRIARPGELAAEHGDKRATKGAKGAAGRKPRLEVVRSAPEPMSTAAVMERLGVDRPTVERLVARGFLGRVREERKWIYDSEQVEQVGRRMKAKDPELEDLIPVGDGLFASAAAKLLGVEPAFVERLARQGFLTRRRWSNRWVYDPAEVALVKSQLRLDAPRLDDPEPKRKPRKKK